MPIPVCIVCAPYLCSHPQVRPSVKLCAGVASNRMRAFEHGRLPHQPPAAFQRADEIVEEVGVLDDELVDGAVYDSEVWVQFSNNS